MKYTIAFLLACNLGWLIGSSINAAARDVSQAQKTGCKAKVML